MFKTNQELAHIFREMAAIFELKDGTNHFRALAYEKAAAVMANLEEDIKAFLWFLAPTCTTWPTSIS